MFYKTHSTYTLSVSSNLAAVFAPDSFVFLPNVCLNLCFRVDQFLEEGGEGTEVEVADNWMGGIGYYDGDFGWAAHGVAEFTTAGKGPCIFADGEEEELECQPTWQEFHQFLEDAGNTNFEKVSGGTFSGIFENACCCCVTDLFLQ